VLRHLRVDLLKIDRTFVRDLETDSRDRAIASCIVDMSHYLGMTVIAEGVETQRQLDVIRAMGCDQAQGFLFSRAVPATAFPQLLLDMGPVGRSGRRHGLGNGLAACADGRSR